MAILIFKPAEASTLPMLAFGLLQRTSEKRGRTACARAVFDGLLCSLSFNHPGCGVGQRQAKPTKPSPKACRLTVARELDRPMICTRYHLWSSEKSKFGFRMLCVKQCIRESFQWPISAMLVGGLNHRLAGRDVNGSDLLAKTQALILLLSLADGECSSQDSTSAATQSYHRSSLLP